MSSPLNTQAILDRVLHDFGIMGVEAIALRPDDTRYASLEGCFPWVVEYLVNGIPLRVSLFFMNLLNFYNHNPFQLPSVSYNTFSDLCIT